MLQCVGLTLLLIAFRTATSDNTGLEMYRKLCVIFVLNLQ